VAGGLDAVAAAFGDRLQVRSGTERAAGTGQDRHRGVGVLVEAAKRVRERGGGGAVDGVAHRRSIDRDDPDRAVPVFSYGLLRHALLLARWGEVCILRRNSSAIRTTPGRARCD